MNNLIYYFEKYKSNYNELMKIMKNEMNVLKFYKKEDFESYLKFDSLALIDSNCIKYLNNDYSQKCMKYCASNNIIQFILENNEIITFKCSKNIISLNNIFNENNNMNNIIKEKINYPIHLIQLINIFYFKKYFYEMLKSVYTMNNFKNDIYLINKKVIDKYKQIFNYQKLKCFLTGIQSTQNINYSNLKNYYPKIINELNNDYINQIKQTKIYDEFNNIDDFIELDSKIKSPSEKNLKYIINFEIVNDDIRSFFIQNNIARKEHFIPCSYLAYNGKILIIFNKNSNNFYEIGHFNDNEDFIIDFLIDELERGNAQYIVDYFSEYGIDYFIKYDANESQKIININFPSNNKFFYCKIEESQINNILIYQRPQCVINNTNKDIKNNKFIKEIISISLLIFTFEKKIKNIFNQNSFFLPEIILLSSKFVNDFKSSILLFDKIFLFLEKLDIKQSYNIKGVTENIYKDKEGKNYLKLILNNEKEIGNYKDKNIDYFKFEKNSIITNSKKELFYPDKFYILDENIFSKIMKILNKNFESKDLKFDLNYNHGKIALKPFINNSFNNVNGNYFIILYSLIYKFNFF